MRNSQAKDSVSWKRNDNSSFHPEENPRGSQAINNLRKFYALDCKKPAKTRLQQIILTYLKSLILLMLFTSV